MAKQTLRQLLFEVKSALELCRMDLEKAQRRATAFERDNWRLSRDNIKLKGALAAWQNEASARGYAEDQAKAGKAVKATVHDARRRLREEYDL